MAERECAGAAEKVFRTRELMPSGPTAESESRVERTFSTFSGAKDSPGAVVHDREGWVLRVGGLGTQDLGANTELKHSTFSRVEWAVVPFEKMEGELTPEIDLSRLHQV